MVVFEGVFWSTGLFEEGVGSFEAAGSIWIVR